MAENKEKSVGHRAEGKNHDEIYASTGIKICDDIQEIHSFSSHGQGKRIGGSRTVIDYVTKYSGLTKESFDGVMTTFDQVKSELVKYIDKDSILVGHGLNGDLRALRLIHPNIIDTSIMFMEGSKRPSLKDLTSAHLGLSIQQDPNGHCSEEDAVAALKLVYHVAMGSHQEQKEVDQHAQYMQLAQQLFNHQLVYSR